jgi:hypothetical protein
VAAIPSDTSGTAVNQSNPRKVKRRSRIAWRLALVVMLVAGLGLIHVPLLRAVAWVLIVDQPERGQQYVLVVERMLAADHRYEEAARLYQEDQSRRILLVEQAPDRAVVVGARPSYQARSERGLAVRNVPPNALEWIRGGAIDPWAAARLLQPWLEARPQARVQVLCTRLGSRGQRHIFDEVLGPSLAARITVRGLADRYCDEHNWWKSRYGVKALMFGYLQLAFAWCHGENQTIAATADPDEYERLVLQHFGEVAP